MLKITKNPKPFSFDCEPIIVELETDRIVTDLQRSTLELCVTGFMISDETLDIIWGDQSVQFEFVTAADDSGYQIEYSNLGVNLFTAQLIKDFKGNAVIRCDFEIEEIIKDDGSTCILFTHKSCDPIEIQASTTSNVLSININNSTGAYLEDNLSAYLKLYGVDKDGNEDEPIELHGNFDSKTARTYFDLSKLFCVKYQLPNFRTITNQFIDIGLFPANDTIRDFYFEYADRYGSPAKTRKLKSTSLFHVVRGAETGDFSFPTFNIGSITVANLQNCFEDNASDGAFVPCKIISKEQPDWVYFYTKGTKKITIGAQVTFADCTEMMYEIRELNNLDVDPNCMLYFGSGYSQLDLETLTGRDDIVCYRLFFKNEFGGNIASVCYEIDCCHPWNCYLAFENGLGGMETWNFKGNKIANYKSTKDVLQKVASKERDSRIVEGVYDTYNHQGKHTWELNTGWYDDPRLIQNLRQLLLGNSYIVDVFQTRFKKVIIETSELKSMEEDDQTLFSYNLTISAAWLDCAFRC